MKRIASDEKLLSYPDFKLTFIFHTATSDKKLVAVISQNNKLIAFFSRILSKPHNNYTITEKELIAIVECLKQLRWILFGYEINVFTDHNTLVYSPNLSDSQRVMCWQLIIEEFGPNIQHISGVDNIVSDTLSRLPSTQSDKYESCTSKGQCREKKLFVIVRVEKNKIVSR